MMLYHYLYRFTIASFLIVSYYLYGKTCIIYYTPSVTRFLKLTQYFPVDDINGVVELAIIAISHVVFCIFLLFIIPIHWPSAHIDLIHIPIFILYGVLLGIGCMGVSVLMSKLAMQLIATFKKNSDYDIKTWLTFSRGGWIKHHLQSMEVLPIYLSLIVLAMQVGSEEFIFRGIWLNYFMIFGAPIALLSSVFFFVVMQAFLMSKWQGAIFPMIGAMVMGVVHSILYLQVPVLWPLIIAHITFFLFAVI